jgi:type I restriction enzyme S subunit
MNAAYKNIKHLGPIPPDWDAPHLEEVTKKKIVYGIVQAGPPQEKGIPYIRSTDVGGNIDVPALLLTTENIALKYSRSAVTSGDIVFSLRGNVGETSIVPADLKIANLTQGTARISVKDKYSNRYVRYALASGPVSRHINAVSKGSTFREITLEDLRKIRVPIPPAREGERIADLLSVPRCIEWVMV